MATGPYQPALQANIFESRQQLLRNRTGRRCYGLLDRLDFRRSGIVAIPCNLKLWSSFVCTKLVEEVYTNQSRPSVEFSTWLSGITRHIAAPVTTCPGTLLFYNNKCFAFPDLLTTSSRYHIKSLCETLQLQVFSMELPGIKPFIPYTAPAFDEFNIGWLIRWFENWYKDVSHIITFAGIHCVDISYGLTGVSLMWRDCLRITVSRNRKVMCYNDSISMDVKQTSIAHFECTDGHLLANVLRCDGTAQCDDDEHDCPSLVPVESSLPSYCLTLLVSDTEVGRCDLICPPLYVACDRRRCVPQDFLCNGRSDCDGGEDEALCDTQPVRMVLVPRRTRRDPHTLYRKCGTTGSYDAARMCLYDEQDDGNLTDCTEGFHLFACRFHNCSLSYKCYKAYCVDVWRLCDGVVDCPSGDDEVACQLLACPGMLRCHHSSRRRCVPVWYVCDGRVQCTGSGDDELYCESCPQGWLCKGRSAVAMPGQNTWHGVHQISAAIALTCNGLPFDAQQIGNAHFAGLVALNFTDINMNDHQWSHFVTVFASHTLRVLQLNHNVMIVLANGLFKNLIHLKLLTLDNNRIRTIESEAFIDLKDLRVLSLIGNRIAVLKISNLKSLRSIDLRDNLLIYSESLAFASSLPPSLRSLYNDAYSVCCMQQTLRYCYPTSGHISSCHNLFESLYYRVLIMLQVAAILFSNGCVLLIHKHINQRELLYMLQLIVCDLMTGTYLGCLSLTDYASRDHFLSALPGWRRGWGCRLLSAVNFVGCQASLSTLLLIAISRAISLDYINRHRRSSGKLAAAIFGVWITYAVTLLSCDYLYGLDLISNDVCTVVIVGNGKGPRMAVLVHGVFIILIDGILLIGIVASYSYIVHQVLTSSRNLRKYTRTGGVRLARIGLVLATSLLCWIPLLVGVALSIAHPQPLGYNFTMLMALLVLPISSWCNPLLYSIIPFCKQIKIRNLKLI